jgi:act minimal PKS acyl carrier protein
MAERTIDELRDLMVASGGVAEEVDLTGDILDTTFTDLSYDSLAVLELAGRIEREWDVVVPDEAAADFQTPRMVLDYVNQRAGVN